MAQTTARSDYLMTKFPKNANMLNILTHLPIFTQCKPSRLRKFGTRP